MTMSDQNPLLPSQSNDIEIGSICIVRGDGAILWKASCCFPTSVSLDPGILVYVLEISKKTPRHYRVQIIESSDEYQMGMMGTIAATWLEFQVIDDVNPCSTEDIDTDTVLVNQIRNIVVEEPLGPCDELGHNKIDCVSPSESIRIDDNAGTKFKQLTDFWTEGKNRLSSSTMTSKFQNVLKQSTQSPIFKAFYKKEENQQREIGMVSETPNSNSMSPSIFKSFRKKELNSNTTSPNESLVETIDENKKDEHTTERMPNILDSLRIGAGSMSPTHVISIIDALRSTKKNCHSDFFKWLLSHDREFDSYACGPILGLLPKSGHLLELANSVRQLLSAVSYVQICGNKISISFIPGADTTFNLPSLDYLILDSRLKSDPLLVHPLNTVVLTASRKQTFIPKDNIVFMLNKEGVTGIRSGDICIKYGLKLSVNFRTVKDKGRIEVDEYGRKILQVKNPNEPVTLSNVAVCNGHYIFKQSDFWLVLTIMGKEIWVALPS